MWQTTLLVLARLSGALVNPIHDCDEVYNFWEPLHFLVHGSGMQTWEYSSQYALRPYLYILLHWPPAAAAAAIFGSGPGKRVGFYAVRICLALTSALLEIRLLRAAASTARQRTQGTLLLALTTGPFLAAPTFLPSTFAMCCMLSATTGVLAGRTQEVIAAATFAVLLGWPVASVAFVPYAAWVLLRPSIFRSVRLLASLALLLVAAVALVDIHFYGEATSSLWNFIEYNVAAGGHSARYGVEPWHYYAASASLNFNLAAALAAAGPLVLALQALGVASSPARAARAVALAPLATWLVVTSALPHKEERFLYIVYPQIVLAAAWTLDAMPRLASDVPARLVGVPASARDALRRAGARAADVLLATTILLSLARSAAIVRYYGAPIRVWAHAADALPSFASPGFACAVRVCTGSEWHRFPSSFFLPAGAELAFVDHGFQGLLPKAFDTGAGGTRAAPPEFNDENRAHGGLTLRDASTCHAFVGLDGRQSFPGTFERVYSAPFVDQTASPAPFRLIWLPSEWWTRENVWVNYTLWINGGMVPCFSGLAEPASPDASGV